jgi:hypothetical protein
MTEKADQKLPKKQAQKTFGDTCKIPADFPSHDEIVKMVQQQAHKNRQRVLMGNNAVRYKD